MKTVNNLGAVLLVMDIQRKMMEYRSDPSPFLNRIQQAIAGARNAAIPVVYVMLSFRPGHPELSDSNSGFGYIKESEDLFTAENEGTAIHPHVSPLPGDIIVVKKRVSAFTGSDLEVVLRGLQARHLILAGFATSGVVLSTVREAADKDYVQTVLSDACDDRDTEVHQFLMGRIFPKQARVQTTADWISSLNQEAGLPEQS